MLISLVPKEKAVPVVVDATGVKVYGEGEGKVRTHGVGKRRTWRKLHLGVDEGTGEILAAVVTTNDIADCQVLPDLWEQINSNIEQGSGDGGDDTIDCYDTITQRQAKVVIPPRSNPQLQQPNNSALPPHQRDENLRRCIKLVASNGSKKADIIGVLCLKQLCFDSKLFLGVS